MKWKYLGLVNSYARGEPIKCELIWLEHTQIQIRYNLQPESSRWLSKHQMKGPNPTHTGLWGCQCSCAICHLQIISRTVRIARPLHECHWVSNIPQRINRALSHNLHNNINFQTAQTANKLFAHKARNIAAKKKKEYQRRNVKWY